MILKKYLIAIIQTDIAVAIFVILEGVVTFTLFLFSLKENFAAPQYLN